MDNNKPGNYYDNSHLCGECTGAGCKQCYDRRGLLRLGEERFPLSLAVNGCKPPYIQNPYAGKLSRLPLWKN